jgi:hypothetical protein
MEKASAFSDLIRRQKETGLSINDFCSNEGIPTSTFYYWRKKLRGNNPGKGFIPLIVKPPQTSLSRGNGKASYRGVDDEVFLELVYPNGTLLRVSRDMDLAQLRALIHLYD